MTGLDNSRYGAAATAAPVLTASARPHRRRVKVFSQVFFKKLAGCGTASHGLALMARSAGKKARETVALPRLSRTVAQLPSQSPNGASSPKGGAKSRLPLWGRCPPKEGGEGQPKVAPGLERGKGSSIEKSQVLCGFQNLTQGSRVPLVSLTLAPVFPHS